MALPFKGSQVDSPEKLAVSNYKIILDDIYYDIAYEQSKDNEVLKLILRRRQPCPWDSSGHCLSLLAKSNLYDYATVSSIKICFHNSITTPGMFWLPGCFESRHSHYLMMIKRSIFQHRLTSLQMKFSAAGLLARWLDEGRISHYLTRKVELNKEDLRPVRLLDIVFAISVLLSGLALSAVVFAGECSVNWMHRRRKQSVTRTALKEILWLD